jgi:hypothetical protein
MFVKPAPADIAEGHENVDLTVSGSFVCVHVFALFLTIAFLFFFVRRVVPFLQAVLAILSLTPT